MQLNLKKLSAGVPEDASSLGWGAGGTQIQWLPDAARTDFSITSGIKRKVLVEQVIEIGEALLLDSERGNEGCIGMVDPFAVLRGFFPI